MGPHVHGRMGLAWHRMGLALGRMGPHAWGMGAHMASMGPHRASMGPHGASMGPVQKINRERKKGARRRLLFAALALGQQPTGTAIKHQSTPSLLIYLLFITDPTCLIAGRDGAPLGERHEALARR
jgi:hypothetical protein